MKKLRSILAKPLLLALAVFVAMSGSAHAAVDLTAAAGAVTTDLASAQTLALPIFATMFGIGLVLAFFKKATH